MTWEEWAKEYPARKVSVKPITKDPVHDDYLEAVSYKLRIELAYEVEGLEIVEFEGLFYIVNMEH